MSAFGRRGGAGSTGGQRPAFGVARPMKGPGPMPASIDDGGDQFPPLDSIELGGDDGAMGSSMPLERGDAMARLTERQAAPTESPTSKNEGFEASIHRIKEQVLPRLLERVDPEA